MAIGQHVAKYLAEKVSGSPEAQTERTYQQAEIAPPEPSMASVMATFAEILQQMKAANTDEAKAAAISQAELLQQLLVKTKPENVAPPLVSVYNPLGERDHPKAALKCKMFYVGFDLKTDTLTPDEIALLNRLEPVQTMVTKADGAKIPFTVTAVRNGDLSIERLEIWFPCKGESRHNHGSLTSYVQQALGERVPSADELLAEITRLKAELAAA